MENKVCFNADEALLLYSMLDHTRRLTYMGVHDLYSRLESIIDSKYHIHEPQRAISPYYTKIPDSL